MASTPIRAKRAGQTTRLARSAAVPAYLWLTLAIFLPLSAMVYFSFLTDLPFGGRDPIGITRWQTTRLLSDRPTATCSGNRSETGPDGHAPSAC